MFFHNLIPMAAFPANLEADTKNEARQSRASNEFKSWKLVAILPAAADAIFAATATTAATAA